MPRSFTALAATAALALLAAGCGGSSSTTSSTAPAGGAQTTPSGTATTTAPSGASAHPGTATTPSGTTSAPSGQSGSGSSSSGDNSIQTYGSEASGADKAAVVAAMRSFMGALASRNYTKVCAGLTASNRAQLQQFLKFKHQQSQGCAALKTLLTTQTSFAAKAAKATVLHFRIKGGTAFALFRSACCPVSFFVMKREQGAWKSTSLSVGTPLNPVVGPPGGK